MIEREETDVVEGRITRLVLEYAQSVPTERPLRPELSLRRDLAIESLSLVSVAIQLGEAFDVDLMELGVDLSGLETVGDLIALGRALVRSRGPQARGMATME